MLEAKYSVLSYSLKMFLPLLCLLKEQIISNYKPNITNWPGRGKFYVTH